MPRRRLVLLLVAAAGVLAVGLAFRVGTWLAPQPAGPVPVGRATVSSIGVAATQGDACGTSTTLGGDPAVLFIGVHLADARPGLLVTVAVTGPDGTARTAVAAPHPARSGCVVVSAPAGLDPVPGSDGPATLWGDGDYAVSVRLGAPPQPSGPVTAFNIQSGSY